MSTYKVTVTIGDSALDRVYLTLMDSEKQSSERTEEISLDIHVEKNIGNIVQVRLEKENIIVNYPWFCKHIKVQTPSGDCFEFPCYCWLEDENEVMIQEGTARLPQDDTESFQEHRKDQLECRQKIFRWTEWSPGFPRSIDAKVDDLPKEVQFYGEKSSEWKLDLMKVFVELFLDAMKGLCEPWKNFIDIENIFGPVIKENTVQENLVKDWTKNYMFGYQFLNGCNPVMIKKCVQLPDKFPVTHEMVQGSLKRGHTLQEELQAGNIYIVDYEILKGVAASKERYLTAPICLLYKNESDQMLPIAIQVGSISGAGMGTLIKNAMKTLTLKSLCLPEDIKARGMEDVPKYYYRDDGMMIWEAIHSFVSAVVKIYYDSNKAVQKDVEIQGFVKDVAFGMNNSNNFPKSLNSREQLVEYLTVVIFTASAQHAAVNFGQFDWYGWIPNSPSTMRKPPPQQKGQVDMKYIMECLPDRGCSREVLGTVWALTRTEKNEQFLGMYPDMYFTEQPAMEAIKTFRNKLEEVTKIIKSRNEELPLPYWYLSPDKIPNSVAI
ncbi:arachidonate 5-lipoxygenase-like protein [Labeo rohita]|uniref:Arachidonate 5-lipoxygenase-like protein n=1 Tax=Labeo rohita TaxID=84645 RepID=A0A498N7Z2_LABRO|nr:arachidonate 5-lipoxygenase-like protein [Labeo rohita]